MYEPVFFGDNYLQFRGFNMGGFDAMLPQKHFCGQIFETATGETSQAQDPAFDNRSALIDPCGTIAILRTPAVVATFGGLPAR
ncbi:hypothetical protein [Sulfitobacter geojensis]|uniref:Uncharacterized protein n=1 Tax=Sulfitobacter geojensis TaxID=1342299 RepID=A0AAE2VWA7_9RHOB|nr:hypothetical protein [Sulfitobacter geojensis]MBM1688256.1 hypothetical protein [Sulfitobacter geojensis]MBM1692323.1 hypothetical protein [Sulfitobacter geojensis]MBM1704489.1 hypothetical protein [Sulfitobacter geojensis]MBM1708547.1 hypothetical protein [Sulfitobacter geojensis]MBM1712612.1 hypothetical protein [Sulfitobacter geojensis]